MAAKKTVKGYRLTRAFGKKHPKGMPENEPIPYELSAALEHAEQQYRARVALYEQNEKLRALLKETVQKIEQQFEVEESSPFHVLLSKIKTSGLLP
jgi:hypothetical protein